MADSCYQAPLETTPNSKYTEYNITANLILNKAQGRWVGVLESLGINAAYLKNKHGSCPACGGKDRFRFDDKGRGSFFCNRCGAGDGIKLLQICYRWNFVYTLQMIARVLGMRSEQHSVSSPKHISYYLASVLDKNYPSQSPKNNLYNRRKSLNAVWQGARPVTHGDSVDCYLKARGIELNTFPSVLRFHPQLPYYNEDHFLVGKFPAMIAVVQNANNHGVTIHRTYLGNSCKANVPQPKKLMSPITPGASLGAAIKLNEPIGGKLGLAEGVETALAFNIATELPTWATVSAVGMEKVVLPSSVVEVTIAVDNDESGRGQEAAAKLTKRLLSEGRRVKRVISPKVGQDFNDLLLEAIL